MKNNAAVRQHSAAEAADTQPDGIAPCDQPAQQSPGNAELPGKPDRTVVRELHKMFALLAIR